jgi:hypothetical protein
MRKLPKGLIADRPRTTLVALFRDDGMFLKVKKVPDERLAIVVSFIRIGAGMSARLVKRAK